MTTKELIERLAKYPASHKVTVASDEEGNVIFEGVEIAEYEDGSVTIFGLSGTEVQESY